MDDLRIGKKYHIEYRWKGSHKQHDFVGVYRGINVSPAAGLNLHTFDLGGGATFYLGKERIKEVEEL